MQPINFKGYVKVEQEYINSGKITKVKEYQQGAAPTVIFYDNGTVENHPEIKDTKKFISLLNQTSNAPFILDYDA